MGDRLEAVDGVVRRELTGDSAIAAATTTATVPNQPRALGRRDATTCASPASTSAYQDERTDVSDSATTMRVAPAIAIAGPGGGEVAEQRQPEQARRAPGAVERAEHPHRSRGSVPMLTKSIVCSQFWSHGVSGR